MGLLIRFMVCNAKARAERNEKIVQSKKGQELSNQKLSDRMDELEKRIPTIGTYQSLNDKINKLKTIIKKSEKRHESSIRELNDKIDVLINTIKK